MYNQPRYPLRPQPGPQGAPSLFETYPIFLELPIGAGRGENIFFNHFIGVFEIPEDRPNWDPERETKNLRTHFDCIFNPNRAKVVPSSRHFEGHPTFKFTFNDQHCLLPDHDDWFYMPEMEDGDTSFFAGALRNVNLDYSPVQKAGMRGAPNPLTKFIGSLLKQQLAQVNSYNILAGRISCAVGHFESENDSLGYIETAILYKISTTAYETLFNILEGFDEIFVLRDQLEAILVKMIQNFGQRHGLHFISKLPIGLDSVLASYYLNEEGGIGPVRYLGAAGEKSIDEVNSKLWISEVLKRHPHLDQ